MNARRVGSGTPFHVAGLLLAFLWTASASAQAVPERAVAERFEPSYELIESGLRSPGGQLRFDATARLLPRHEVRLSSWSQAQRGGLESLPGVSLATLSSFSAAGLDFTRATYRYTFFAQPQWAWKVGVSANMRESGAIRSGVSLSERGRFGALPLLHFSGEGTLAPRWRLSFDADGLMTARGRAFDLGLRVNYSLTQNFFVFGGYRLTEFAGEAEEVYGSGVSNAANVGMRYRF